MSTSGIDARVSWECATEQALAPDGPRLRARFGSGSNRRGPRVQAQRWPSGADVIVRTEEQPERYESSDID
jgi:hypothetical protein